MLYCPEGRRRRPEFGRFELFRPRDKARRLTYCCGADRDDLLAEEAKAGHTGTEGVIKTRRFPGGRK
jgi:hypothetical protein